MPPLAKLNAPNIKRSLVSREKAQGAKDRDDSRPGYWGGTGILAGPMFSDRDRTRRSPSPPEVVEFYRSIVYICTRINYNAFSKQNLHLYKLTKNGQSKGHLKSYQVDSVNGKQARYLKKSGHYAQHTKGVQTIEEIVEHPLLDAITREVNPQWDHTALMRYTSMCLDLFGRSHWWMESMMGGRPDNVWPLLSQYMLPYREGNKYSLIDYFNYGAMRLPYTEVMEVRDVAARDPYALGVGPAEASFAHYDLFDMFISYERNVFEQGAAPKMIVSNKDPEKSLGRVERERLQRDINYGLVRGQQGIAWVLDGDFSVQTLSFLPEGMAKLNIGKESLARVANCFGVPVSFLDITTSNRSTSESDRKLHAELMVDPRCALVASALNKWTWNRGKAIDKALVSRGSKVRAGFDRLLWAFDNPVPEDEERHQKVIDMQLARGQRTINQINAEEGLPDVAWGDEPWMNMNLIQPSIAEDQRQWSREQAEAKLTMQAASDKPGPKKPGAARGTPGSEAPALPKPAPDELQDAADVVPPGAGTSKPKSLPAVSRYALPAPSQKAKEANPFAAEWDLAETLLRSVLVEMGLGMEAEYADETITPTQRIEALHILRLKCREAMRAMADRTLAEIDEETEAKSITGKAKESFERFFTSAKKFVKAHIVAASLVVFGPGIPTAAEIRGIDKATAVQEEYLAGFRKRVLDGDEEQYGRFAADAELYGAAVWGVGNNLIRDAVLASGLFTEEQRFHIGIDFPCPDCVEQVDEGRQPIGTLLSIGSSQCKIYCHCRFSFYDANGNEYIAGRGPLEEDAFGRTG